MQPNLVFEYSMKICLNNLKRSSTLYIHLLRLIALKNNLIYIYTAYTNSELKISTKNLAFKLYIKVHTEITQD